MTNHTVSNREDLRERTKTMSRHGDRQGQIAAFRDSFETINWLYLLFKCGIKTKTHFEWLLWHWSSLGQLNLEPTRPNGLVGCKVPTDLVKISVKEAMHMSWVFIIEQRQQAMLQLHLSDQQVYLLPTKAQLILEVWQYIFDHVKVPVRFLESHAYLTGVTAVELQWHLSNMNMIFNRYPAFWWFGKRRRKRNGRNWLSNP